MGVCIEANQFDALLFTVLGAEKFLLRNSLFYTTCHSFESRDGGGGYRGGCGGYGGGDRSANQLFNAFVLSSC